MPRNSAVQPAVRLSPASDLRAPEIQHGVTSPSVRSRAMHSRPSCRPGQSSSLAMGQTAMDARSPRYRSMGETRDATSSPSALLGCGNEKGPAVRRALVGFRSQKRGQQGAVPSRDCPNIISHRAGLEHRPRGLVMQPLIALGRGLAANKIRTALIHPAAAAHGSIVDPVAPSLDFDIVGLARHLIGRDRGGRPRFGLLSLLNVCRRRESRLYPARRGAAAHKQGARQHHGCLLEPGFPLHHGSRPPGRAAPGHP